MNVHAFDTLGEKIWFENELEMKGLTKMFRK